MLFESRNRRKTEVNTSLSGRYETYVKVSIGIGCLTWLRVHRVDLDPRNNAVYISAVQRTSALGMSQCYFRLLHHYYPRRPTSTDRVRPRG